MTRTTDAERLVTLPEKLAREIARVTKLSALYKTLPANSGVYGAFMMDSALESAIRAAGSPDVEGQIRAVKDLEGFTS